MADLVALNGRAALVRTARRVLTTGEEVSPRGQRTKELRHFSLTVRDPYDILCTGINAGQSREVIAAETLQLIGGFCDPEFAVKHAPNLHKFRNASGGFDGAYGPRLREVLPAIVARLKSDPDTRQAIVPIWRASDATRTESLDYPCTLTLGFYVRRNRLEMDVAMRSNDVNWGLKNDLFQFTQLQLSIAHLLGVEAGPYRHTAFSMHLYERDWEWADQLDGGAVEEPISSHPIGIVAKDAEAMMARAQLLASEVSGLRLSATEVWYREALAGK